MKERYHSLSFTTRNATPASAAAEQVARWDAPAATPRETLRGSRAASMTSGAPHARAASAAPCLPA